MRRERISFSRPLRNNYASFGPLGISMKKPTPATMVKVPQMNRTRHGAVERGVFLLMSDLSKHPMIWTIPFIMIQRAIRTVCSFLRYQLLVMVTNAGETAPSLKPRRKRTAAKSAKFVGAKHVHTIPQMILF